MTLATLSFPWATLISVLERSVDAEIPGIRLLVRTMLVTSSSSWCLSVLVGRECVKLLVAKLWVLSSVTVTVLFTISVVAASVAGVSLSG